MIHPQINMDSNEIDSNDREDSSHPETKIESSIAEDVQGSPAHLQISPHHVSQKGPHITDHSIPQGLQGALIGGASEYNDFSFFRKCTYRYVLDLHSDRDVDRE